MNTKRLIRISYFTMLTVVGGLIRIPVGTVAFTFQSVFVILSAFIIGGSDGAFSQIAYTIIGLIGLPVFASGGGLSYVFQPSFGYILGFILGAFVTGKTLYRLSTLSVLKLWFTAVLGLIVIYLIGIAYQVLILTLVNGLTFVASLVSLVSVIIYFAVDIALVYLLALIYPKLTSLFKIDSEKEKIK